MRPLPTRIVVGVACASPSAHEVRLSSADLHVAEQAAWLASRAGADLLLVHVLDRLDARLTQGDAARARELGDGLSAALEGLARAAAKRGVGARFAVVEGEPWAELTRVAARERADLLALGPHREGVDLRHRVLQGSTVGRLLRSAPMPVWIVDPARVLCIQRVLALVDRSPVSARVIETAAALTSATGAERHALHCLTGGEGAAAERDVVRLTGGAATGWRIHLAHGSVPRAVLDCIRDDEIDLVVLGSSARRGLAAFLGSMAEQILDRAVVSTWVVRPDGERRSRSRTPSSLPAR